MTIDERVYSALSATGIDVTQRPVVGDGERYLTWEQTLGTMSLYSSNEGRSIRHMITVHLYSREPVAGTTFWTIVQKLKLQSILVSSWGPEAYETDTAWYHLPITCYASESIT